MVDKLPTSTGAGFLPSTVYSASLRGPPKRIPIAVLPQQPVNVRCRGEGCHLHNSMEPKNEGLEDDFPFQTRDFQVSCSFSRVYFPKKVWQI